MAEFSHSGRSDAPVRAPNLQSDALKMPITHSPASAVVRRLLIVDDNHEIHNDIRKVLLDEMDNPELDRIEAQLFGESSKPEPEELFEVTSAFQGREGLEQVLRARQAGKPFHVAIVDMRMPPGWDGLETIERVWEVDPDLQIIICTAFSDYTWEEMVDRLGIQDRLLILKKPFDDCELQQMVRALGEKRVLMDKLRDVLEKTRRLALARATHPGD